MLNLLRRYRPVTADGPALDAKPQSGALAERLRALPRPRPELGALLVLALVLNTWALTRDGWANDYYSAAVRSMSTSWHAFLYISRHNDPDALLVLCCTAALWFTVRALEDGRTRWIVLRGLRALYGSA